MPNRVLPVPAAPCTKMLFARGIPPSKTSSRPAIPVLVTLFSGTVRLRSAMFRLSPSELGFPHCWLLRQQESHEAVVCQTHYILFAEHEGPWPHKLIQAHTL